MDWSRAKTILILSFLLLNILLGYQLWTRDMQEAELVVDMEEMIDETNRLLLIRNIRVPNGMPKDTPKLKEITVRLSDTVREDKVRLLESPIRFEAFSDKLLSRDYVIKFGIPRMEYYQFDSISSEQGVYVLNQLYEQIPLFDVRLELVEENGSIIGYKQRYAEADPGAEARDPKGAAEEEQKVISSYVAVRKIAETYLPEGTTIVDVRLGYHGQQFDSPTMYMLPYWRVVTQQGDVLYVNALNGAFEASPSGAVVTPKP